MNAAFSHNAQRRAGFTLIELSVALGVSAILLGQAVPAASKLRQDQLLRAEADELASDIRFAKAEAQAGEGVTLRFDAKGPASCYVIHTGTGDDCVCKPAAEPVCKNNAVALKSKWLAPAVPASMKTNAQTMFFAARQGLVGSTASIELASPGGTTIRQVVAMTGRIRTCTVTGKVAGLTPCR